MDKPDDCEQDDKRKELEVAEIMCGIQQKTKVPQSADDIQQKAIDQHHQRQAEQITGATPYHLSKQEKDEQMDVELVEMIDTQNPTFQAQPQHEDYVFEADNSVTYTIQENQQLVTKTEQFEGNQIIIMNDTETFEEMYSEQQDQITYLDETGNEIGESNRPQQLSSIKLESLSSNNNQNNSPVYIQTGASGSLPRRKSILQVRQPPKIQIMDAPRETQFIQIQPQQSQPIQISSQNYNQKSQPVLYYQTILLPPPGSGQQSSQIQVQNSNIIQIPSTQNEKPKNERSNVIFLSPNGTIETQQPTYRIIQNNKQIEYVKVDQNHDQSNLLDIAATQAGLDLKTDDSINNDDDKELVKTEQVQSHHAYPSPFSQIPIADRTHQCKYCPKRFARADECKRHERIHTDTRPFACTYCPRRFTRKDHLRTHTRCHTKEKPYICPICNRGFARSDERIRHIKTHVKKNECTMEEARKKLGNVQVGRRPTRNVNTTTTTTTTNANGQTTVTVSPVITQDNKQLPITIHSTEETFFTPKITIIAEDDNGTTTTTTTPGNNNVS